jgi:hypothetical protein
VVQSTTKKPARPFRHPRFFALLHHHQRSAITTVHRQRRSATPLPTQNLCIAVGYSIPSLGRLSASTVDKASSSAIYSLACYY